MKPILHLPVQDPCAQTTRISNMAATNVAIGVIFLSQTVTGILGNSYLLHYYLLLHFRGYRLRSTDYIQQHLLTANILSLLCDGVPQTMAAFGWKDVFWDIGCKLLSYLHRVGRTVSISSTCFLSVFQVITISPMGSTWSKCKLQAPRYIGSSTYLTWILSLLVNIVFPVHITGKTSNTNITSLKEFGYCSAIRHDKASDIFYSVLLTSPDMFFVGLMLWSSSSMVFILYRHKQRMKHIHRSNVSLRSSSETRATKTILLLVSTFVCFYTVSCLVHTHLALVYHPTWFMVNAAAIVSGCFPTVSPFLLMTHDSCESSFCSQWARNRKY
ncbi:vomeronasal type-1 receptor 4-like [Peromyscus californicus insignis]|uniref:vomeronasal type-1 receptor 4-like n=1 Tax=Peromyscus californicus insignis TaxID=564181 RepID=UPI0022A74167|nr:vomeronasal type-1 receptor 4-like [Peromyscus californicus insignis]